LGVRDPDGIVAIDGVAGITIELVKGDEVSVKVTRQGEEQECLRPSH
jgi:hypothetical protein